jgi:serine/threonine protein kinase/tetratricopeptide (TPR) repeat protein
MAGDQEGAARRAQDGIAVSSGDSSAATPKPALGSEAMTDSGFRADDVTLPTTPVPLTPTSDPSDALTIAQSGGSGSASAPHPIFSSIGATVFHEGDVLGERYEILKLLGMGGMGAVYKARDMEVERVVGLKVIRPDLAGDPAILARFKQELVLARQVTHKNIIRIYDLNEASGVKFITMEFIEGEDLRSILLREGKLLPREAADIIAQVCAGLQAAHSEGVIHRDLKPSNVMRDASGRVKVMDFGLARTVGGDGMTRTGMMVGTMEYMSPEQAMGKGLTAASDQFTVGLIFYELLSGTMPYHAESAIASLVKRTQERAVPLTDVDPSIPPELSAIVSKCLERDPAARFASMQELIDEIEIWEGKKRRGGQSVIAPPLPRPGLSKPLPWKWIAVAAAAVALAAGTYVAVHSRTHTGSSGSQAMKGPVLSVAVLPFYNGSGDPSLNWIGATISDTLTSDIGQSAHLHLVSSGSLQDVLRDMRFSATPQVEGSTLNDIRHATDAETIISGQMVKAGDQLRINAIVHDLKNSRDIPISTDFASVKELADAVGRLAGQVRQTLATTPDILKELQESSQHVLTNSVSALQAYDEGLQLDRAGDNAGAVAQFEKATTEDANFAMAYARLAESYFKLGNDVKAQQASLRAMDLSKDLPRRDQYLIEANHARITKENDKAITAYENLVRASPNDSDAQFVLADLYERAARFDDARKMLDKVLAADPKYVNALYARGRVDIKAGKPDAALDFLNKGLSLAIKTDNKQEKGNILNALGVLYDGLGKREDALSNYQQALEMRKSVKDVPGTVMTQINIALLQDAMGDSKAALASFQQAIDDAKKNNFTDGLALAWMGLGTWYHDHGNYDDALKLGKQALQIYRQNGNKAYQAKALNNIGSALNNKGQYQDALTNFDQAYQIREQLQLHDDAIESLHNTAEMNFKLGQYETAKAQFLKAMSGSKAADDKTGLALDSSSMGALFAAQGEYDKALGALNDAIKGFQDTQDRSWFSVEALARYGDTLAMVGRGEEGQKYIEQALNLAEQVKVPWTTKAEALNALGDSYFFRGDYSSARQQYQRALQTAGKTLTDQSLRAQLDLARLDLAQGRAAAAVPALKKIAQDASTAGLRALSVQASLSYAQALLETNQSGAARQQLEDTLGQAEALGMRVELARAQYLMGKALTTTGKPKDAALHFQEAARILRALSTQPGAEHILDRPDLKAIYSDATSYQGGAA